MVTPLQFPSVTTRVREAKMASFFAQNGLVSCFLVCFLLCQMLRILVAYTGCRELAEGLCHIMVVARTDIPGYVGLDYWTLETYGL